jgi:hypothetical protein
MFYDGNKIKKDLLYNVVYRITWCLEIIKLRRSVAQAVSH